MSSRMSAAERADFDAWLRTYVLPGLSAGETGAAVERLLGERRWPTWLDGPVVVRRDDGGQLVAERSAP